MNRGIDMVKWEDGTHEILTYNDDNGYGLTRCERRIGPWDAWWVGRITCKTCKKLLKRAENLEKHNAKGPREWFPGKVDKRT